MKQHWDLDILAAEDTPSDIQLLEIALARCGQVRSLNIVRDGQEVINYLKGATLQHHPERHIPNILFMDLHMPRMTGLDVLKWLRLHPDCSVIPTIIMSSSGLDDDVIAAYQAGANAYFEKPTSFEELQEILKTILTFWSHAKRPPIRALTC